MFQIFFVQGLQNIDSRSRKQGRVDLKGGIFGGCTNESEQATFNMRQERVLLAFVETMNFVYKHNGSLRLQPIQCGLCFIDRFSNVFDATQHRTDADKLRIKCIGHEPSNGGFADTRWAPQNATVWLAGFKCQAKGQALTNQMLLTNDLTQMLGTQALCQRLLQMNAGVHGRMTCTPAGALN